MLGSGWVSTVVGASPQGAPAPATLAGWTNIWTQWFIINFHSITINCLTIVKNIGDLITQEVIIATNQY